MKNCITFLFLLSCLVFFDFEIKGQDPDDAHKRSGRVIPEAYDRSSISWVLVYNSGDSYTYRIKESYENITHTDKFFLNPLEEDVFEFKVGRSSEDSRISADVIDNRLKEKNISQQIISHWYNRTDEGFMDMERIHERGMVNATDADVIREQSTTRGNWALMDYGNRLIDRSYVVAIDFSNVSRVETDTYDGYRATVYASLFRVNLSEEDKELIYDAWVLEDDSEEEAIKKRELYEAIDPSLKYVTQISRIVISYNYQEDTFLGSITPEKSTEELFQDLVQDGYDDVLFELERDYEDFNVITPLYSTRPLEAKIGKKEGLSVDQRFFVYEHRYDPETQDVKEVRRGVIRATSNITDNREIATGDMDPSRFYQVAGRRLDEGYVMQQSNDYGIGINFGADIGGFGGGGLGVDFPIGRTIGIRAFHLTANLFFDSGDYAGLGSFDTGFDDRVSFLRWDVGFAKGLHFFRHFELRPNVGMGMEIANSDDLSDEISTIFFKVGGNLAINITYYMQIVGGYNLYSSLGAFQDEDLIEDHSYSDIFDKREGESIYMGLRFKF